MGRKLFDLEILDHPIMKIFPVLAKKKLKYKFDELEELDMYIILSGLN
jgi:hypothetical protein